MGATIAKKILRRISEKTLIPSEYVMGDLDPVFVHDFRGSMSIILLKASIDNNEYK
jgi:hypothetical protein